MNVITFPRGTLLRGTQTEYLLAQVSYSDHVLSVVRPSVNFSFK